MTSTLLLDLHPLQIAHRIVAHRGKDLIFTYSRYTVAEPGRQAEAPRSPVLRVSATELTQLWLRKRLAELGPTEEMAIHSWVECNGVGFHIPMVDFVSRPGHIVLRELDCVLAAETRLDDHFVLFDSGRSLHGYFPDLIPEHIWPKYLGRLLVLNEHDRPPVIDSRWVGHALVRGFAALRWSCNTSRYLSIPRIA